jgi:hypothetical protein
MFDVAVCLCLINFFFLIPCALFAKMIRERKYATVVFGRYIRYSDAIFPLGRRGNGQIKEAKREQH